MKEHSLNLGLFDFHWKIGLIRYSFIFLLCLVMAHLVGDLVPFSKAYSFPIQKFLGFLWFGLTVCTTSWVVTNLYRPQIFRNGVLDIWTFQRFIIYNVVGCFLAYTLLFIGLSFPHFDPINYLTFLLVSMAVVVIENLVFLLVVTYQSKSNPAVSQNSFLLAPLASRQLRIDYQDISHAKINSGIVTIFTNQGKPISTQYGTLDQLQKKLPSELFFRANRQFIINKNAVEHLARGINRKLSIQIRGHETADHIVVSRYKSKDIQRWLEG